MGRAASPERDALRGGDARRRRHLGSVPLHRGRRRSVRELGAGLPSPGRRGHPGGGGVQHRRVRCGARPLHRRGAHLHRRRPRAGPPPPADLRAHAGRLPRGLAGASDRPGHPLPHPRRRSPRRPRSRPHGPQGRQGHHRPTAQRGDGPLRPRAGPPARRRSCRVPQGRRPPRRPRPRRTRRHLRHRRPRRRRRLRGRHRPTRCPPRRAGRHRLPRRTPGEGPRPDGPRRPRARPRERLTHRRSRRQRRAARPRQRRRPRHRPDRHHPPAVPRWHASSGPAPSSTSTPCAAGSPGQT